MAITAEQREERRKRIHSSDISKILGCNPWGGPADVQFEKLYETEDRTNNAMSAGNYLEPVIIKWLEDKHGFLVEESPETVIHEDNLNGTNLDGRVKTDPKTLIEAKTSGVAHWVPGIFDEWGADGTDEVPDYVSLQCHHQMAVTGADLVIVGAFLAGNGPFHSYEIRRDEEMCRMLLRAGRKFYRNHVIEKKALEDWPLLGTVQYIKRQDHSRISIEESHNVLAYAYEGYRRREIEARKEKDSVKAKLLASLGNHDEGVFPDGSLVTYHANSRGSRSIKVKLTETDLIKEVA